MVVARTLSLPVEPSVQPLPVPAGLASVARDHRLVRHPSALPTIDVESRVLIVGGGLGAINVLRELHARGHSGRTVALSPTGLWPYAHGVGPGPNEGIEIDRETADDLRDLWDDLVLVDRAAVVVSAKAYQLDLFVEIELTAHNPSARRGQRERWSFDWIVLADEV
jgi:uncharacterized NAD(P)/FAD-binding protein YdhS